MKRNLTNASPYLFHTVLEWQQLRSLIVLIPLCVLGITSFGRTCIALPPNGSDKPVTQEKNANLTEGLLDLLNEPAPKSSRQSDPSSLTPTTPSPSKPIEPNTSGAEKHSNTQRMVPRSDLGEDLGRGPGNPLSDVQVSMKTAAGWLKANRTLNDTRQLQKDIVSRLDDLISDLDQQSSKQQSSASNEPAPSSNSKPSQSAEQTQSQARSSSESTQPNASDASKDGEQSNTVAKSDPSQSGGSTSQPSGPNSGNPGQGPLGKQGAQVDLKDPQALVRSAWGKLPERVREQMQSRMVERFLPKYREEIEAYYRALAK